MSTLEFLLDAIKISLPYHYHNKEAHNFDNAEHIFEGLLIYTFIEIT